MKINVTSHANSVGLYGAIAVSFERTEQAAFDRLSIADVVVYMGPAAHTPLPFWCKRYKRFIRYTRKKKAAPEDAACPAIHLKEELVKTDAHRFHGLEALRTGKGV